MMIETQTIPQPIAERYLITLKQFVSTVRTAIGSAGGSPQSAGWQRTVLPLLESRMAAAETALSHHAIGDQQPLVSLAMKSRFLAREIDGYSLRFAGENFGVQLEEQLRLVVFAAWQVCESAGVV